VNTQQTAKRLTALVLIIILTLAGLPLSPALALTYSQLIIAANPDLYYRLGESSGTNAIDAAHGITGAYASGVVYAQTGAITYDTDTAIKLSTGSSLITLPTYQPANRSFAVELWFKFASGSSAGADKWLWRFTGAETYGVYARNQSGTLQVMFSRSTLGSANVVTSFTADVYHHLVTQFNANAHQTEIYLDAALVFTIADTPFTLISPTFNIGNGTTTCVIFYDEFAVYPRVMTQGEINQHYSAASAALTTPTPTITYTPSITPTLTLTPTPTNTPTPTITPSPTPGYDYAITLPGGGQGRVAMDVSAGEILNGVLLFMVVALLIGVMYAVLKKQGSS